MTHFGFTTALSGLVSTGRPRTALVAAAARG
jgi:hypothetical protein